MALSRTQHTPQHAANAGGAAPQLPLAAAGQPAPAAGQQTALAVQPQARPPVLAPVAPAFAGMDLAGEGIPATEFGLLNVGGALEELGGRLPLLSIEYLAKKEHQDAGLRKGQWTMRHTLQQAEELTVILAAAKLQRVWREKYDPRAPEQKAPWCYSADGQTPCAGERQQPGPCVRCKLSQWQKDPRSGKRTPPECTSHQVVLLLVRDPDDQLAVSPMITVFKRTGLGPYRTAMDVIKGRAMQWGRTFPQNLRHLAVQCVLGVQDEQTYYSPTFGGFSSVEAEEAANLVPILHAVYPAFLEMDLLQLEDEPEADAAPAAPAAAGYPTATVPSGKGDASFDPAGYDSKAGSLPKGSGSEY